MAASRSRRRCSWEGVGGAAFEAAAFVRSVAGARTGPGPDAMTHAVTTTAPPATSAPRPSVIGLAILARPRAHDPAQALGFRRTVKAHGSGLTAHGTWHKGHDAGFGLVGSW